MKSSRSLPPKIAATSSAEQRSAMRILQHLLDVKASPGDPLIAGAIADTLGVSRFPVQRGLSVLAEEGLADRPGGRGYVLRASLAEIRSCLSRASSSEQPYLVIARDRLRGVLPKSVHETELAKHYGLTRAQLGPVLKRMAQEGWIRRGSGYGWEFTDIIDSIQAYSDMYAFRMAIEPAALLCPSYRLDVEAVDRLREEQRQLRDGRLGRISSEERFEIGARFHETIVGFSNNPFFISSLKQINQLRRLLEYKAMAQQGLFTQQCDEHLALLDLLTRDERGKASTFLHRHLDVVRAVKRKVLEESATSDAAVPVHF